MINTVNVILGSDEAIVVKMASFEESEEGNNKAQKVFLEWIGDNFPGILEDVNSEDLLDEGYFEKDGYSVSIVHSTEI